MHDFATAAAGKSKDTEVEEVVRNTFNRAQDLQDFNAWLATAARMPAHTAGASTGHANAVAVRQYCSTAAAVYQLPTWVHCCIQAPALRQVKCAPNTFAVSGLCSQHGGGMR